jgi:methanogenic corrinoid protein MtbC1
MELIIKEIHAAVMKGDSGTAQVKVQAGLPASLPAAEILNGMIAAMAPEKFGRLPRNQHSSGRHVSPVDHHHAVHGCYHRGDQIRRCARAGQGDVGGSPANYEYAHKIDADGFATDASRAVAFAKSLISAGDIT